MFTCGAAAGHELLLELMAVWHCAASGPVYENYIVYSCNLGPQPISWEAGACIWVKVMLCRARLCLSVDNVLFCLRQDKNMNCV